MRRLAHVCALFSASVLRGALEARRRGPGAALGLLTDAEWTTRQLTLTADLGTRRDRRLGDDVAAAAQAGHKREDGRGTA
jgi:hypothetical protein